jgi:DNA repair protein RadC
MNDAKAYMVKVMRVCEVPSGHGATPTTAHTYWRDVIAKQAWFDADKEHLVALLLNADGDVQAFNLVSIGSITETIAYPREIFRAAVANAAFAIVLMHNHPVGAPTPSDADKSVTDRLRACGALLGIPLIDHVIVAEGASYSFKENGLL